MRCNTAAGFTLLELITTLAISALTLGMALPSIGNILNTNRLAAEVNALHGSLDLARSEAVRRNDLVILCKSPDGQKCSKKADWTQGWIAFADTDHDKARDASEKLILVHAALSNGHTLTIPRIWI